MKAIVTAIAAVATLAAAGAASAQDYRLPANFGSVSLRYGFTPDPYNINVVSGGSLDARGLGGNCRGTISNAPDVELNYQAGSLPLIISVNSNADTTLVINAPDGRWYCSDDEGVNGLNPAIRWDYPSSGTYDIWVGSYSGGNSGAVVGISELYSY